MMTVCLAIALLSTLIYLNLVLSDAISARLNPYSGASRSEEQATTISKIKYWLLLIMAITWAIYIRLG